MEADEKAHQVHATFEVSRVWKGDFGRAVTVITADNSGMCGVTFRKGDSYLVYATERDGKLHTNICTRPRVLAHAQEDLDTLGEGKPPAEGKGRRTEGGRNAEEGGRK